MEIKSRLLSPKPAALGDAIPPIAADEDPLAQLPREHQHGSSYRWSDGPQIAARLERLSEPAACGGGQDRQRLLSPLPDRVPAVPVGLPAGLQRLRGTLQPEVPHEDVAVLASETRERMHDHCLEDTFTNLGNEVILHFLGHGVDGENIYQNVADGIVHIIVHKLDRADNLVQGR